MRRKRVVLIHNLKLFPIKNRLICVGGEMSRLRNTLIVAVFIFIVAMVSGCNGRGIELQDGDTNVTNEMDELISSYIISKYTSSNRSTEKQFEVHKVYGTSKSNGILSVYMWSYFGGFNKSTGVENQSGHSLPAVMQLKRDGERYSVIKYVEPQDGSLYSSSLKKMFPKKYLKFVQQDAGNIKHLQSEMDSKVKKWLME
ncbi:hypothetical protein [Paenibacillus silviterrae]|uniref:hypothetical protein n=1 Tax=Paenibacillus silviterrae TaxID=3242194 RepID=UPI0025436A04|nr:hypothetical protein [Paenibacillus chinjuensis]